MKLQVTKTHWSAPRDAIFLRTACKQRFNTHLVQYQFSTGTGNKEQFSIFVLMFENSHSSKVTWYEDHSLWLCQFLLRCSSMDWDTTSRWQMSALVLCLHALIIMLFSETAQYSARPTRSPAMEWKLNGEETRKEWLEDQHLAKILANCYFYPEKEEVLTSVSIYLAIFFKDMLI